MQTSTEKSPTFYVSESTGRVRVSLWPDASSLHVSMSLDVAAALRLAKKLTEAVERLPRVAEASDLGIAA